MADKSLDTREYWEKRLASNLTLQGTGHRAFSLDYNQWLYQAQRDSLSQILQLNNVAITGEDVLDVGSGNGFFVDYYINNGARTVTGMDIAPSSVEYLRRRFPTSRFYLTDIASVKPPIDEKFSIVSVISVLYHILDKQLFQKAMDNLCSMVEGGGFLLLSDTLTPGISITARHARFHLLQDYEQVFKRNGVRILQILPIYYLLNRSFVPLIGPYLISLMRLGEVFYRLDTRWRAKSNRNGSGMKLMLAQKI